MQLRAKFLFDLLSTSAGRSAETYEKSSFFSVFSRLGLFSPGF